MHVNPLRKVMRITVPPRELRVIGSKGVLYAALAGAALRLAWVLWSATPPTGYSTDAATYLRMSIDLTNGRLPTIGGNPTAFFSPGYPALLAIPVALGRLVGGDAPFWAAVLANIAFSVMTIVFGAALATQVFGSRHGEVTAWLLAVSPSAIYLTSHLLAENAFVAAMFVTLFFSARFFSARWFRTAESPRRYSELAVRSAAIGAMVAGTTLIRSPGAVLLIAPVLMITRRNNQVPNRMLIYVGLGFLVTIAPWTIRNYVSVGVPTPFATNNATALCGGNRDGADGRWVEDTVLVETCLRHSPWDNPAVIAAANLPPGVEFTYPDEKRWYSTTMSRTMRWIVTNIDEQPRLIARRFYYTMRNDSDPTYVASHANGDYRGGELSARLLAFLGNAWYATIVIATINALVRRPNVRAERAMWACALALLCTALVGVAYPMFRFPATMLAVVIASASFVRSTTTGSTNHR